MNQAGLQFRAAQGAFSDIESLVLEDRRKSRWWRQRESALLNYKRNDKSDWKMTPA